MPHSWGYKSRTRDLFAKEFRRHGKPGIATSLTPFKRGEYVDIVANSAIHNGMPHKTYHGKTGKIWNVTRRALVIQVKKRVRQRIMLKKICVRVEHVRKSRCKEGRMKMEKEKKKLQKVGGNPANKSGLPNEAAYIKINRQNKPTTIGVKKFVFAEVYKY
eukprot:NODE_4716_length_633_cov_133.493151_g4055_i0.p2 GENE.NODE_4716_length_633_cov_133.493151_g4055_i0~~NODE_4716_length_633_cov_133.493151_g4055_i0.p2  ORF type:complete len:160 (+),score=33.85 NODE_4716_length_633_cov_133.493151_g4055_i0:53-532(+)